jgi:hypothetical protein
MKTYVAAVVVALATSLPLTAQGPNPVNLFVVDLKWTGNKLAVGAPVKLTRDQGSNGQPSFTPDGRAVLFSAVRDTGSDARSDIYRIDLATLKETRVTTTPENENSPTMNDRGEYVAVRWVPATLFKEFGPWVYSADGSPVRGVLPAPDTTGYYTLLANGNVALTRPKSKTFTLGLFDANTGTIVDVDSGVPALPAVRVPGERALTYVRIDTVGAHHMIRRLDLATRKTSSMGPTLVGRTAHAWIAGRNTILMAKGNALHARGPRETTWRVVATFDNPELRNATAYVVSPKGDKLILVSPRRLSLGTVIRDSLEAGRSGAEVAAMVVNWRDAGKLADLDVTEGGVNGAASDRIQKKRIADGLALQVLATTMFPNSYRAYSLLGDAQRAAGDSTSALTSYRKSLQLNPRGTEAERNMATAVEKKIGTP